MHWLMLVAAIVLEVIGTSALKVSHGFAHPLPGVVAVAAYAGSLTLLSFVLKTVPIGIAYGIWCGAGIALVALVGYVAFGQRLDIPALAGLAMVAGGVALLVRVA